jgi:hypothetical protein
MERNAIEAAELMAEGDRLLGRAWEYGRPVKAGLSAADLDLAEYYYAQAAEAYLVGAVEYQSGRAVTRDGAALEDPTELVQSLQGSLRAEAESALRDATAGTRNASRPEAVESARTFAEELRDRFAHAAPELFHGAIDIGIERPQQSSWSR